jgi:nucleotide-binding universal stress UspA family protein
MLATLDVPFEEEAARLAVDSAVESGQRLIVVSVEELLLAPMDILMGWGPQPEAPAYLAPAELAASLGVPAERLRVKSPHPLSALLELVAEREPGLLVFGPDRSRLKPRRYRKAARAVRERACCLVWLAD